MNQPTLRDRARTSVEPVARVFGRLGLSPNALTLIGFCIALVAAYFAATHMWLVAGLLVAFGAAFDLLDGALARATGRSSRLGAFMDSVFDRAGEGAVYIGLIVGLAVPPDPGDFAQGTQLGPLVAAAAMAAAFMVSYTRAKSESLGFTPSNRMAEVGLAPREVRVVILVVGLILAGVIPTGDFPVGMAPAYPFWWQVLVGSLGLIAILATITTIQRIVYVYLQAKKEQ
ncbi:MAG TPA: CDP-alcohol phosphatidyltransferase family protein [Candidatus Limnocylindria bacterium]|nr:CDP-alcohol phosphatidyltransferase family protein [Candidatus Limnocylindria bacterium]